MPTPSPADLSTTTTEPRAISREQLATLPLGRYEGPILWVDDAASLSRAATDLQQERVVGFDTETRPAFRKGEFYHPSLVQVATQQQVYLFPLRLTACYPVLTALLQNPCIIKTGVALAHDLRMLNGVFPVVPTHILDLGTIAKRHDYAQTGVRNLAGLFLDLRIPKGEKTTNWSKPELTPAQHIYAATDAWICRQLYLEFAKRGLVAAIADPQ